MPCFNFYFFYPLFFRNQGSAFDFGELEEAFALSGIKIRSDEAKSCMFHCFSFHGSPFDGHGCEHREERSGRRKEV